MEYLIWFYLVGAAVGLVAMTIDTATILPKTPIRLRLLVFWPWYLAKAAYRWAKGTVRW